MVFSLARTAGLVVAPSLLVVAAACSSPSATCARCRLPEDAVSVEDGAADGPSEVADETPAATGDNGGATDQASPDDLDVAWSMPARPVCAGSYAQPADAGRVQDEALVEASGIVPSPSQPGVLWLHNDSGDSARLFALGTDGTALARLNLPVNALDIEDIAAGPCPDGSGPCLWVADVGDNGRLRPTVFVHAVREPALPGGGQASGDLESERSDVWTFRASYPDGAVDCEAILVAPDASTFYLIEKVDGPTFRIFAYPPPWRTDATVTLEEVVALDAQGAADVPFGRSVTAADLHPGGSRVLVRLYGSVVEYRLQPGESIADLAEAAVVPVPSSMDERQGEAIAYDEAGTGIWTVSEGEGELLHHVDCQ